MPPEKRSHKGLIAVLVLIVLLVAAAAGLALTDNPVSQRFALPGAQATSTTSTSADAPSAETHAVSDRPASQAATAEPEAVDMRTPVFGNVGDVLFHLAVPTDQLTEIMFHQASYDWALSISTQLPDADLEAAGDYHGTSRPAEQPTGDEWVNGSVLRLWRYGRTTANDTAVDCGAPAYTPCLSPVDGTVVLVEQYKLYGKIDDYQIHIQPYGHPELDVVLIHLEEPQVVAGDKVVGGETQIAVIRNLDALDGLQLAEYTYGDDPGYHTHICANDAYDPGYFGLVGAAAVDSEGNMTAPATITAETSIDEVVAMRRAAAKAAGTVDITVGEEEPPSTDATTSTAQPV